MKIFYKPVLIYFIIDFLLLVLSIFVLLEWFPLTTADPYNKYALPALYYIITWLSCSYIFGKYQAVKKRKYLDAFFQISYITLFVFGVMWIISNFFFPGRFSINVLIVYSLGVFVLNYIFIIVFYAWINAVEYDHKNEQNNFREKSELIITNRLDEVSYNNLCDSIEEYSGKQTLNFLKTHIDLKSGNTKIMFSINFFDLKSIPNFHFSTFVQLELLNNIKGINKLFAILNEKISNDGKLICCFESKSTRKKRILDNYPPCFSYIIYTFDYLFRRVTPKIQFLNRLYFKITNGKNRILSKTEVLGRLYCCGFEVTLEKKIGNLNFVIVQRIKQPETNLTRVYGPFIRLRRLGENGKEFNVYKMRTMHPYSEFLQKYIFERNQLKEGGKFNKDIRINTLGKLMRKYWIDELPMLINLLKGEMKIVGVRPLSSHYFSLYSKELQEKRIKFKPGLLPPFYADMPKTLEEIQASELKYLLECEVNGITKTDLKYFFVILRNIFFKKARSS